MLVSELASSLEESQDELQVAKRKNTALIKVSVCLSSGIVVVLVIYLSIKYMITSRLFSV